MESFLFSNSAHIRLALPQAALISDNFLSGKSVVLHLLEGPVQGHTTDGKRESDLRAGFKPTTFHLPDHRPAIYVTLQPLHNKILSSRLVKEQNMS